MNLSSAVSFCRFFLGVGSSSSPRPASSSSNNSLKSMFLIFLFLSETRVAALLGWADANRRSFSRSRSISLLENNGLLKSSFVSGNASSSSSTGAFSSSSLFSLSRLYRPRVVNYSIITQQQQQQKYLSLIRSFSVKTPIGLVLAISNCLIISSFVNKGFFISSSKESFCFSSSSSSWFLVWEN